MRPRISLSKQSQIHLSPCFRGCNYWVFTFFTKWRHSKLFTRSREISWYFKCYNLSKITKTCIGIWRGRSTRTNHRHRQASKGIRLSPINGRALSTNVTNTVVNFAVITLRQLYSEQHHILNEVWVSTTKVVQPSLTTIPDPQVHLVGTAQEQAVSMGWLLIVRWKDVINRNCVRKYWSDN